MYRPAVFCNELIIDAFIVTQFEGPLFKKKKGVHHVLCEKAAKLYETLLIFPACA